MINPFNRFYDTEVSVYSGGEDSYAEKGEKVILGTVICDLQPYDTDTEREPYGLEENKAYKLFCDNNDLIKNGRYIYFGGTWYIIVRSEEWKLGMSAIITGVLT